MSEETVDKTQIKFPWLDRKYHIIQILDSSGCIDIGDLIESATNMLKEKEAQCKNIYYLALGITRDDKLAEGFTMGWLVKTIKDATEKASGEKWKIEHDTEDISIDEYRNRMADELNKIAEEIRNSKGDLEKFPILKVCNGNNLFE